jgi:nucleoside-diphosphate-sugar epimerase
MESTSRLLSSWHKDDHIERAGLESPPVTVRNQVFNVGSDEQNYTIQQVAEIIQRLVPTAQVLNMGLDADRRNYRVNFCKIHTGLDFVPQWSVAQGVQ